MDGDHLSCYVLVFTVLSCVSKGGAVRPPPRPSYSGGYGRSHGYALHVPEVVTTNTFESLVSACSNSSTCQGNRTDAAVYDYYCNCDDSCATYDTCCNDSKHGAESGNVTKPDADVKCVSLRDGSYRHVFMVDTCKVKDVYVARSSRHVNTHIYTHCRSSAEDNDNPFLMIPVTSKVTGTTYKNYFCAVCNEDIYMDQLALWDLTLEGQSNASEVHLMSALRYSPEFKSWVVMKNENILNSSRVSISLEVPKPLVSAVQFCRKGLVAKCAANWTEETVKEKCGSYMAVVSHCEGKKEVLYRNPHCAICNHMEVSNLHCGRCSWEDNIRLTAKKGLVEEDVFRIVIHGRIMSRYR
ncbi:uncharacterized protein CDAR_568921 [Caerostris darwini]|uniref:SMB domain-containing protein n=1 Tax=Caerostris darwini TaxID=1538125 RepID=A0AAV4MFY9_9ARAC|nr:uncharacterized protein CDAR_568921 [Caerostris darwini]